MWAVLSTTVRLLCRFISGMDLRRTWCSWAVHITTVPLQSRFKGGMLRFSTSKQRPLPCLAAVLILDSQFHYTHCFSNCTGAAFHSLYCTTLQGRDYGRSRLPTVPPFSSLLAWPEAEFSCIIKDTLASISCYVYRHSELSILVYIYLSISKSH